VAKMRQSIVVAACLGLLLALASCASTARVFVNPDADLAFYKKIAVMPFGDISAARDAGPRVTRAFVTELIMSNRFELIQPEDFIATLYRMGINRQQDGTYDAEKLKTAATQLGVTGILRGAVTEYQMSRAEGGDIPVIAFDAELIDVATGKVVWRSTIAKRGKGRIPLVGGNTRSLGKLTQDACRQLVDQMKGKAL
jgi:TolB-like protein